MTAWSRDAITIGPEMMAIGLSLANIAMADTQQDVEGALVDLWNSAQRMRSLFEAWNESADIGGDEQAWPAPWQPREIRAALDLLSRAEEEMQHLYPKLIGMIQKRNFVRSVDESILPFTLRDLEQLLGDLFKKYQPNLREARLALILEIAKRTKSIGVDILQNDIETFKEEFRGAKFEDTMGWQETAHLAASPENAKRVLAAIASVAPERTEASSATPSGP